MYHLSNSTNLTNTFYSTNLSNSLCISNPINLYNLSKYDTELHRYITVLINSMFKNEIDIIITKEVLYNILSQINKEKYIISEHNLYNILINSIHYFIRLSRWELYYKNLYKKNIYIGLKSLKKIDHDIVLCIIKKL
tara:strand:- start:6245 stop:6655 length:411 start_codon:yes stop_codon:yes gene_type:complete